MQDREKITLTGAQETMLATLYGRALDSRLPGSVLNDRAADEAVARIDYDFRKTRVQGTTAIGIAIRAKQLDIWTQQFLGANPSATVLHLACGLDTRAQRLAPGKSVRWIDLDMPDVIALRSRLLSEPEGDYRMVAASVTSDEWLSEVPADRPTVAVFEGLAMYLHEQDGKRLIQRICQRFPSGQLLFDVYGSLGIKLQKLVPAVRNAGATLHWGVDDPRSLESLHDGLTCLDALRSVDLPYLDRLPRSGRISMRMVSHIPALRDAGRLLRYLF
ncbi:O-methyltransferase involved in polyketide biosynthesis [Kibdelosporangium banguiense]|uniref:O-methyltransferase involved in polyketide biosynthesis n=1 Tax=Kibdelosporangium banguiense TaxID=1365924 RepID=A0ABS4TZT7_9PSEU|nr:class I SAM-dependent methyltransferase [Kibdelosporangium banguiense]MBP2329923.1 O-methyltransferase involved in polyketide biosynthesis [Kibdelosporangium banguiense]